MILSGLVPLIIAIAGALMYSLSANVRIQEMGRILFAAGAFAFAFFMSGRTLAI
jgi:hypothetical protein